MKLTMNERLEGMEEFVQIPGLDSFANFASEQIVQTLERENMYSC